MQTQLNKVCFGLALGCLMGTIAACQTPSDTVEQPIAPSESTDSATPEPVPPDEDSTSSASATSSAPDTQPDSTATAEQPSQTTAQSDNASASPLPTECAAPQTQTDMNLCAQAEYEQAAAKLNTAIESVQTSVAGQKEWTTYRDNYCDFVQSQFKGGSIQPMIYSGCLTQLTSDRTAELEKTTQASASYSAADQELNEVYQDLQGYLAPEAQELLTDAQLAWIDYRDAHCTAISGDTDACLARITEAQVKQLREQLDVRSL